MATANNKTEGLPVLQTIRLEQARQEITTKPTHNDFMKAKQIEKMKAGKEARTAAILAKCASQTIVIDENWSIVRLDERNWSIRNKMAEKDGFDNENYFGSLFAALKALPAKMLSDEASDALAKVIEGQKAIRARIVQAVHAIEKMEKI